MEGVVWTEEEVTIFKLRHSLGKHQAGVLMLFWDLADAEVKWGLVAGGEEV